MRGRFSIPPATAPQLSAVAPSLATSPASGFTPQRCNPVAKIAPKTSSHHPSSTVVQVSPTLGCLSRRRPTAGPNCWETLRSSHLCPGCRRLAPGSTLARSPGPRPTAPPGPVTRPGFPPRHVPSPPHGAPQARPASRAARRRRRRARSSGFGPPPAPA